MSNLALEEAQAGRQVTLVGVLVNLFLIVFKFGAGFWGHSQALIADAAHSVSDLFTDLVVLVGLKAGRKEADQEHPFGHARLETVASAVVGLALVGVAVYLGVKAGQSVYEHTASHPTWLALVAAGFSIALKETLFRYTLHVGRRIRSPVVVANAWHHRSDALSSVAVFLGVLGAQITPSWHILDAYAALFVSFFILKVGFEVLGGAIRELTDTAPGAEVLQRIGRCAHSVSGVEDVHDVKVRTAGGLYQMEIHVVVDARLSVAQGHRIAKEVEACLFRDIEEVDRIIVHVDPASGPKETPFPKA